MNRTSSSATMVLPPRARPGYWPRSFPRTLVKTCVLALGVLLWLLYFYSTSSFSYDRRPSGGASGDNKRSEGFILRRPTVPLFEGPVESETSTTADDVPGPSGGSRKPASSAGPEAAAAPPSGPGAVRRGTYAVLENLLESRLRFSYNQSVTITTHATYELLDNLIYLSRRWRGPISVAVYAPCDDFKTALLYALWLRQCHQTIRDYVTFHFVYPAPAEGAETAPRNLPERSLKSWLASPIGFQKSESSSSTEVPQKPPEISKAFQYSTSASKPFLETESASDSFQNISMKDSLIKRKTSLESSNALKTPSDSSKALKNSSVSPKALKSSSVSSKDLKNSSESSKALETSPESSKALKKSSDSSKALRTSSELSKALKNSPEVTVPFDESLTGYEQLAWDTISRHGNASGALGPSCGATSFPLPRSYRHRHGLPYPINVCRNVARLNAKTHFVLASDIELYPSADVAASFLEFSRRTGLVQQPGWVATQRSPASSLASFFLRSPVAAVPHPVRRVYVLPIFEVDRSIATVPATKAALVDLYRHKKAVYFHKHVCSFCNIIPRLNRWLVAPAPKGNARLGVFMSIKRHKPFNRWEPIYIGTNNEPLYDERLTWEGQQDKMTQMYELCLMNYDLAILDNAFLVHRPGIKSKNATEYKLKSHFIAQNNKIYKSIIADLERKHGSNSWCK